MKLTHRSVAAKYGEIELGAVDYKNGGFILEGEFKQNEEMYKIHVCFTPNDIYKAEVTDKSTVLKLVDQDASVWVTITRSGVPVFDDEVDSFHFVEDMKPSFPKLRLVHST